MNNAQFQINGGEEKKKQQIYWNGWVFFHKEEKRPR